MDCSLPGSSVHGILHIRILEWVAISFFRWSSLPRNWTWVSCIAGIFFTIWATTELLLFVSNSSRLIFTLSDHSTTSKADSKQKEDLTECFSWFYKPCLLWRKERNYNKSLRRVDTLCLKTHPMEASFPGLTGQNQWECVATFEPVALSESLSHLIIHSAARRKWMDLVKPI